VNRSAYASFARGSGLLEVSGSIRAWYGLDHHGEDLLVSSWLREHDFRCLVTILIDAMGAGIIEKHAAPGAFVRRAMAEAVPSVFPPTTSAATTAFLTGRSPAESGWLGWHQYFAELDDDIILFLGRSQYGPGRYGDIAYEKLPVVRIFEELCAKGIPAEVIWPAFAKDGCKTFHAQCERVRTDIRDPQLRYIYVYWDQLDDCMHHYGPGGEKSIAMLAEISQELAALAESLPEDVGLLVLADHGQVDVENVVLKMDTEMMALLKRPPSLEARASAFFVKEGKEEAFASLFQQRFPDQFDLWTREEVLSEGIFGPGQACGRLTEFIGDYLAVARTPLTLVYDEKQCMKGHHAGLMEDEVMIPVLLWPRAQEDYTEARER
jgi:hypothetical protein